MLSSRRVQAKCSSLRIHYICLLLDTQDEEVYKNWCEGGYLCSRKGLVVPSPPDRFVPIYRYKWKPEEMPREAEGTLISSLQYELSALSRAKYKAVGMRQNSLDLYFHFSKVDSHVFLASAHAYPSIRSQTESEAISEFINTLSMQLKLFSIPRSKKK
mgnify:CR=1 FL=1